MRRLLAPLALTLLVAIGLSACDASISPGAARVGSETISKSTLTDAVKAVADDAAFVCTLSQESSTLSIKGAGSGTYDAGFTASQLTEIIKDRISTQLLAKLGVEVTPAATAIGRERLDAELNPPSGSTCTAPGTTAVADLPLSYRNVLTSEETNLDLVAAKSAGVPLTTAGLAAYASAHQSLAYNVCVSAILTTTAAKAAAAGSAISSGQSFASVAKADSQDTNSASGGGVLGCLPVADFQSPLNTALEALAVGQVSSPIQFTNSGTTGYVLLLITGRQAPTTLEALNVLVNAEDTAANKALATAESTTDVRVDPQFGTWRDVDGNYEVVPPVGPASGFLANPTAITPTAITTPTTIPLG